MGELMKWKASSMVEVLVALVIIILVFGSSTAIYIKLVRHRPEKAYHLRKELSALAIEVKNEDFPAATREHESISGLTIVQYCEPFRGDSLLLHLKLEVIDNEQVVVSHEELFLRNQNVL